MVPKYLKDAIKWAAQFVSNAWHEAGGHLMPSLKHLGIITASVLEPRKNLGSITPDVLEPQKNRGSITTSVLEPRKNLGSITPNVLEH